MTSEVLILDLVRGAKMAANASSVTAFGKLDVTEMGRCKEKKADAAISLDFR